MASLYDQMYGFNEPDDTYVPVNTRTRMGDIGRSLKSGIEQLPGVATGLLDLPTALTLGMRPFNTAANAVGDVTGFEPGQWAKDTQYSDNYNASRKAVGEAWDSKDTGPMDVLKAIVQNPMYSVNQVVESLPAMAAGGVVSKGLGLVGRAALQGPVRAGETALMTPGVIERLVGAKAAPAVLGPAGEGIMQAGSHMNEYEGDDARRGAVGAIGSGIGDALIGYGAGRVANHFGFETAQTAMAGGAKNKVGGLARRMGLGAADEALLQELPQSAQEKVWENYSNNKPLMDGVTRAGVEGAISGGLMGAGANISGRHEAPSKAPVLEADKPADLLDTTPPPTPLPDFRAQVAGLNMKPGEGTRRLHVPWERGTDIEDVGRQWQNQADAPISGDLQAQQEQEGAAAARSRSGSIADVGQQFQNLGVREDAPEGLLPERLRQPTSSPVGALNPHVQAAVQQQQATQQQAAQQAQAADAGIKTFDVAEGLGAQKGNLFGFPLMGQSTIASVGAELTKQTQHLTPDQQKLVAAVGNSPMVTLTGMTLSDPAKGVASALQKVGKVIQDKLGVGEATTLYEIATHLDEVSHSLKGDKLDHLNEVYQKLVGKNTSGWEASQVAKAQKTTKAATPAPVLTGADQVRVVNDNGTSTAVGNLPQTPANVTNTQTPTANAGTTAPVQTAQPVAPASPVVGATGPVQPAATVQPQPVVSQPAAAPAVKASGKVGPVAATATLPAHEVVRRGPAYRAELTGNFDVGSAGRYGDGATPNEASAALEKNHTKWLSETRTRVRAEAEKGLIRSDNSIDTDHLAQLLGKDSPMHKAVVRYLGIDKDGLYNGTKITQRAAASVIGENSGAKLSKELERLGLGPAFQKKYKVAKDTFVDETLDDSVTEPEALEDEANPMGGPDGEAAAAKDPTLKDQGIGDIGSIGGAQGAVETAVTARIAEQPWFKGMAHKENVSPTQLLYLMLRANMYSTERSAQMKADVVADNEKTLAELTKRITALGARVGRTEMQEAQKMWAAATAKERLVGKHNVDWESQYGDGTSESVSESDDEESGGPSGEESTDEAPASTPSVSAKKRRSYTKPTESPVQYSKAAPQRTVTIEVNGVSHTLDNPGRTLQVQGEHLDKLKALLKCLIG